MLFRKLFLVRHIEAQQSSPFTVTLDSKTNCLQLLKAIKLKSPSAPNTASLESRTVTLLCSLKKISFAPSIIYSNCTLCMLAQSLSHVRLFATSWTVAHHAPLSIGFSRQEGWRVLPFLSPGDLPDPGVKAGSLLLGSLLFEPPGNSY